MAFHTEFGNIFDFKADVIVMPANPNPKIGNGLDKLIYHEAGRNTLLKARRKIGNLELGETAMTDAYNLRKKGYRYIVHAVSPSYDGGSGEADELLKKCYANALQLATAKGCKSIVFPLLSTGVLKYPKEKARNIAEGTCKLFLADHKIDITLVIYEQPAEDSIFENDELSAYILENSYANFSVDEYHRAEREWSNLPADREEWDVLNLMRKQIARKQADEEKYQSFLQKEAARRKKANDPSGTAFQFQTIITSLDEHINSGKRPSFNEVFERFRESKKAGTYAEICKKANLRQDTLSKLRSETISPHRDYLWALAIAIKLDLDETEELFNSCGLSLHGGHRLQETEERRERALEYGVDHAWNIKILNAELEKRNFLKLGNYI